MVFVAFLFISLLFTMDCHASGRPPASLNLESAGNADEDDIRPPAKRHLSAIEKEFASWSVLVNEAYQSQKYPDIQNLYYEFDEMHSQDDPIWEQIAQQRNCLKWKSQDWKAVVGADVFLKGALGAHLYLVIQALRPLDSPASWSKVEDSITQILKTHPFIQRRAGLYGLVASSHLGHPIAKLVLYKVMEQLPSTVKRSNFPAYLKTIQEALQADEKTLRKLIASAEGDMNLFSALTPQEKEDTTQLQQKSDLGFPHYKVLMGLRIAPLHKPSPKAPMLRTLSQEDMDKSFQYFMEAGKLGDFEGYSYAAEFVRIMPFYGKFVSTDYSHSTLIMMSFCLGNLEAYKRIPGTKYASLYDLFGMLRGFLNRPHRKK